ncbi:aspartate/glutamate racemase family protein [Fluviibacterium sp. DFM31]|uniref:Aspartate/glutamate racemase family protein n=1 Tax=Meridianimarinicoccus marinus TaxID=3231483 RepID=A0ABV3LB71_9RHOB
MRLLFLNPNTSTSMAETMAAEARRIAAPGTQIDVHSAGFGSSYISTRSEAAVAGHALLSSIAAHYDGHDAIIVGAFIIPAVSQAAKEFAPVPLIATGEAGLATAQLLGPRFSILSIGAPARKMTFELVEALGQLPRLASIRDMGVSGTDLVDRQQAADDTAVALALDAIETDLADVIVLGAGSMEGMADRIRDRIPVPVVSPVASAVIMAEGLVRMGHRKPTAGAFAGPEGIAMTGLDPALSSFFSRRD